MLASVSSCKDGLWSEINRTGFFFYFFSNSTDNWLSFIWPVTRSGFEWYNKIQTRLLARFSTVLSSVYHRILAVGNVFHILDSISTGSALRTLDWLWRKISHFWMDFGYSTTTGGIFDGNATALLFKLHGNPIENTPCRKFGTILTNRFAQKLAPTW